MGTGGGEMAGWLAQNGVADVNYLIGNFTGFYEYLVNYQFNNNPERFLVAKNNISFYTPISLCRELDKSENTRLIDLRADTLFAKPTNGTKLTYRHLQGVVNFPFSLSADEFEKRFPDKKQQYVLIPHNNYTGMELADALLAKGYKIGWLMAGNERWEWYTNNIEDFKCRNYFVL